MCFKLDNGSELFSVQDMHRLRTASSGVMGSSAWTTRPNDSEKSEVCPGNGDGTCSCKVKCARCTCLEKLAAREN